MACFVVSAVTALGVGAAKYVVAHHEKKNANTNGTSDAVAPKIKWSSRLKFLELTLWGGSFLLAGEHLLHGEISPVFPFLTALKSEEETAVMWKEMGTVGVAMTAVLVASWGVGVFLYEYFKLKKQNKKVSEVA